MCYWWQPPRVISVFRVGRYWIIFRVIFLVRCVNCLHLVPGTCDSESIDGGSPEAHGFGPKRSKDLGTHRFREDIGFLLGRFLRQNPGRKPSILKVSFRDAMTWHTAEGSRLSIPDFVDRTVKSYVETIPVGKSPLSCSVELLSLDKDLQSDDEPTHFE